MHPSVIFFSPIGGICAHCLIIRSSLYSPNWLSCQLPIKLTRTPLFLVYDWTQQLVFVSVVGSSCAFVDELIHGDLWGVKLLLLSEIQGIKQSGSARLVTVPEQCRLEHNNNDSQLGMQLVLLLPLCTRLQVSANCMQIRIRSGSCMQRSQNHACTFACSIAIWQPSEFCSPELLPTHRVH